MKCKECPQCDHNVLIFQYWELGFYVECGRCAYHIDIEDEYVSLLMAIEIWNRTD